MTYPKTTLYGYTAKPKVAHLVCEVTDLRSTCGKNIVTVPDPQPTDPAGVSTRCARYMASLEAAWADRPRRGECPECGADVSLDFAGRLRAHGQYRMGPSGPYRSQAPCPGKGMEPAGE